MVPIPTEQETAKPDRLACFPEMPRTSVSHTVHWPPQSLIREAGGCGTPPAGHMMEERKLMSAESYHPPQAAKGLRRSCIAGGVRNRLALRLLHTRGFHATQDHYHRPGQARIRPEED
jgi:hypothetical protein